MSQIESAFCRSRGWHLLAQRGVLPWALQGNELAGNVLEVGTGSGAMAAELLQLFSGVSLVATDFDGAMVARARRTLAPFAQRADAVHADATTLPFADSLPGHAIPTLSRSEGVRLIELERLRASLRRLPLEAIDVRPASVLFRLAATRTDDNRPDVR